MYVTGVADLQTVLHRLLAKVQVVILNLQRFLQIRERRAQLLGPAEDAREVVVSYSPVTVPFLSQRNRLMQQLKRDVEVLFNGLGSRGLTFLQEAHREYVADNCRLACRPQQLPCVSLE